MAGRQISWETHNHQIHQGYDLLTKSQVILQYFAEIVSIKNFWTSRGLLKDAMKFSECFVELDLTFMSLYESESSSSFMMVSGSTSVLFQKAWSTLSTSTIIHFFSEGWAVTDPILTFLVPHARTKLFQIIVVASTSRVLSCGDYL